MTLKMGDDLYRVVVSESKLGLTRLRAKFHVLVPVHFLSGWETGDTIQKIGDVTHLMKG